MVPIRFVDDAGEATTSYPFNPSGSAFGIGGLCSDDGRHLAMMPHPGERRRQRGEVNDTRYHAHLCSLSLTLSIYANLLRFDRVLFSFSDFPSTFTMDTRSSFSTLYIVLSRLDFLLSLHQYSPASSVALPSLLVFCSSFFSARHGLLSYL